MLDHVLDLLPRGGHGLPMLVETALLFRRLQGLPQAAGAQSRNALPVQGAPPAPRSMMCRTCCPKAATGCPPAKLDPKLHCGLGGCHRLPVLGDRLPLPSRGVHGLLVLS